MHEKRTLIDANQIPCLTLKKAIFSFGTKWTAYRGGETTQKLFTVQPKIFSFSPQINIFLDDGDNEPDFKVKGSWLQKDFKITDVRNGQKRVIAQCNKERMHQSVGAFFNAFMGVDNYFVTIQPGVDTAFITAICCLLDDIYQDKK